MSYTYDTLKAVLKDVYGKKKKKKKKKEEKMSIPENITGSY